MLGLPIAGRLATLAIPAMLALIALAAGPALAQVAQQPSVETLMYHMNGDRGVKKARKAYIPAVHAAMLYSQCPEEYRVDDAKKARFNAELAEEDHNLRTAFSAAHQTLTGKLPSDAVNKAITETIATLQHDEALKIGTLINNHKKGCSQSAMKQVDNYYEGKYAYELQQQAAQAAAEEKRRLEVPAVIESQETKSH